MGDEERVEMAASLPGRQGRVLSPSSQVGVDARLSASSNHDDSEEALGSASIKNGAGILSAASIPEVVTVLAGGEGGCGLRGAT